MLCIWRTLEITFTGSVSFSAPLLLWALAGDWTDRFPHSPPRIHAVPGHTKAQKQLRPLPRVLHGAFHKAHEQNGMNWGLRSQFVDGFRQTCHEAALTCSRALLPTLWQQQAALPAEAGELPAPGTRLTCPSLAASWWSTRIRKTQAKGAACFPPRAAAGREHTVLLLPMEIKGREGTIFFSLVGLQQLPSFLGHLDLLRQESSSRYLFVLHSLRPIRRLLVMGWQQELLPHSAALTEAQPPASRALRQGSSSCAWPSVRGRRAGIGLKRSRAVGMLQEPKMRILNKEFTFCCFDSSDFARPLQNGDGSTTLSFRPGTIAKFKSRSELCPKNA